jgi:hypothetical protein
VEDAEALGNGGQRLSDLHLLRLFDVEQRELDVVRERLAVVSSKNGIDSRKAAAGSHNIPGNRGIELDYFPHSKHPTRSWTRYHHTNSGVDTGK